MSDHSDVIGVGKSRTGVDDMVELQGLPRKFFGLLPRLWLPPKKLYCDWLGIYSRHAVDSNLLGTALPGRTSMEMGMPSVWC
jgi:hypothetical protein